jgi:uncharacterized 2Fe-2S/4Fe-4S cluster protein (DUF4445 family)
MLITVHCRDRVLTMACAPGGSTLARLLRHGELLPLRSLCLGIGQCGRCRVRFLSPPPAPSPTEQRILSPGDLERGLRLACRHQARDGMVLAVDADEEAPVFPLVSSPVPACAGGRDLCLAVDLGTTSVAWQAQDAEGNVLAAGQILNPQMTAGSDVVSRLAEASTEEGAARMRGAVGKLLRDTVDRVEVGGWSIREIGLAANPAMTALALGKDSSGLRAAPYRLDYAGGREERLPHLPPLWIPPQIGPFAGGDVSAGLALLLDAPRPFLLVDMGTNGEFLLVRRDQPLLAASVPLGPALEGVGMRCGGLAGPGAATAFHLTPSGLEATTPGGGRPRSISGTGYLSLLQCLLRLGLVDENGHFAGEDRPSHPLASLRGKLARTLYAAPPDHELRLPLPGGLFLGAGDVESILKVKAAFSLALECLLSEAASLPQDMDRLYLAGALGQHAPLSALEDLGFLPPRLSRKTTAVGNASLQGIGLLLRSEHPVPAGASSLRERLRQSLEPRRVLDLASEPRFQDGYIRHMRFGPGA